MLENDSPAMSGKMLCSVRKRAHSSNKHTRAHTQIQIYFKKKLNVYLSVLLSVFCATSFWLLLFFCFCPSCQDQTQAQTQSSKSVNDTEVPMAKADKEAFLPLLQSSHVVLDCVCVCYFLSLCLSTPGAGSWRRDNEEGDVALQHEGLCSLPFLPPSLLTVNISVFLQRSLPSPRARLLV